MNQIWSWSCWGAAQLIDFMPPQVVELRKRLGRYEPQSIASADE